MSVANRVLSVNDDLPIRTDLPVHSGKVRSVYWLTDADSRRLAAERGYDVAEGAPLAVMVISDRMSAFDCLWQGEGGMRGVPGKGAALNAISSHWFALFGREGLAQNHILEVPHPLVWIVQKARPVMIEAICRQYITGSMWRAYSRGERNFCGIELADGLIRDQRLDDLLITPSTKGVLKGIEGVPEQDDVNITRQNIERNCEQFGFRSVEDIDLYESLLTRGFGLISDALKESDQIFVDTKFEFGYVTAADGTEKLIYMDEVGTPDSSRIWDGARYRDGEIVENSKEGFRQQLLGYFSDPDILLNGERMKERLALAQETELPESIMMQVSETYLDIASRITGQRITLSDDPRAELVAVLGDQFGLIDQTR